jgi:hypothetical protein
MADKTDGDILFDAILKTAISEAYGKELHELSSIEGLSEYKPSPELEQRIEKLITKKRRETFTKHFFKTAGKIAACICIIFTVASAVLMSIEATRTAILNAFVELQGDYTKISFGEDEAEGNIYRPTYLPEGFSETSEEKAVNIVVIVYTNMVGEKIYLNQWPAEDISSFVSNKGKNYVKTEVSGNTAYLFEDIVESKNTLLWQEDGLVFELTSSIESEELIRIGESIEK